MLGLLKKNAVAVDQLSEIEGAVRALGTDDNLLEEIVAAIEAVTNYEDYDFSKLPSPPATRRAGRV